ncbi:hypothetical protein ACHAXR_009022 [Thalassiosira sp. AJA248-18]
MGSSTTRGNNIFGLKSMSSIRHRSSRSSLRSNRRNVMQKPQSFRRGSFFSSEAKIQPEAIEGKKSTSQLSWWHAIFIFSGVSLLVCLLQIFLPSPFGLRMTSNEVAELGIAPEGCEDGLEYCICPRPTICATNKLSLALLALARCSAFFDYPLYMMMFLTKAHNINNILRRSVLREWIDFADMHHVHTIFGIVIGVETIFHSMFHVVRWGINNDIELLWSNDTGITGAIAAASTPLIVWPMAVPKLKQYLRFEIRKSLHYLFYFWAAALMWHAPSRIYYLIGVPFLIYVVDFLVGLFVRNHLLENVYFERYGEKGVAVRFENPKGYRSCKTSYVYIMCPWISKWQWHAFTLFPEPNKENNTMLCIGSSGDWTKAMHDKIKVPCLRSMYIVGPFSSEFSDKAVHTTNAVAIASGIGITPTLSLMLSYVGIKRINIIWMCRDPGLVEYILHKIDIHTVTKNSFALIFYTGKRDLLLPKDLPVNLFIFRSRPNLEETISGIVTSIDSGEGLPEEMYKNQKALASIPFSQRIKIALARIVTIYSEESMFEYAVSVDTETRAEDNDNNDPPKEICDVPKMSRVGSRASLHSVDEENAIENAPVMADEEDVVSIDGLEAMISSFLGGIGEYSRADIEHLFDSVDTDGSGYIDKDEFDEFINLATGDSLGFSNSTRRSTIESITSALHKEAGTNIGDEATIKYMEDLVEDPEKPLNDWSMFYCGGSSAIEKRLRGIGKKYKVDVGVEKFDW